jgi:hypothetical protein
MVVMLVLVVICSMCDHISGRERVETRGETRGGMSCLL